MSGPYFRLRAKAAAVGCTAVMILAFADHLPELWRRTLNVCSEWPAGRKRHQSQGYRTGWQASTRSQRWRQPTGQMRHSEMLNSCGQVYSPMR
jgi:hypothetical protein